MKTKVLLLFFWFIGFSLFSQSPTLTMFNSGPQPGDVLLSIYTDTTGVGFGAPGANQNWDYSNLVIGTSTHKETYMIPDTFPPHIPNATTSYFTGDFLNYLNVNASGYSVLAVSDIPVLYMAPVYTMIYSDPLKLFTYPFSFSDSFTAPATASYSIAAWVWYYRKGTSSTMADGYGTLLLPSGTFSNVLRVKNIQDLRDSVVRTNPFYLALTDIHNETYLWYDGIHKTPLLRIQQSTKTIYGTTDTTTHTKSVLVADGLNGIKDRNEGGMTVELYPNPAVDRINLTFNLPNGSEAGFSILTMTGNELLNVKSEWYDYGEHTKIINVSSLPGGIYIVKCTTSSGSVFRKLLLN